MRAIWVDEIAGLAEIRQKSSGSGSGWKK